MAFPTITAPDQSMSEDEYNTTADAFAASLGPWADEATELAASMDAIAAGTAYALPYKFSTTTTIADPTAGYLRLNNATQNAATSIALSNTDAQAQSRSATLETLDDSTSTVKGHLAIVKQGDGSKWLLLAVTAITSPSGYHTVTASVVDSSAASPFANDENVLVKFTRTGDKGDKGDTGATGAAAAMTLLATLTPTAAANIDFLSTFSSTYDSYLIVGQGILPSATDTLLARFANGGSVDTGSNYASPTLSSSVSYGNQIHQSGKGVTFHLWVSNANDATNVKLALLRGAGQQATTPTYNSANVAASYIGGAVSGVRLFWSGGANFQATGKVYVFGIKNT